LADTKKDIFNMGLEQLMNIEIVTASRKSQSLLKTAAAVHIITQEDIRRSGATSLPEVLRGVPGLQIAQIDANNWAISIRGMNDRFANNLLVMIDGRSIYNSLFGGVYWNMHETLLEDIERIEVVRGPGGTLWGANAVNGVINIITKNTKDTQGTQFSFIGGSQEKNISARHGGMINDQVSYRFFTKGKHVESFNNTPVYPAHDQWRDLASGFRVDGDMDASSKWMLQGGYNVGHANQLATSTSLIPPIIGDGVKYQSGKTSCFAGTSNNQQTANGVSRATMIILAVMLQLQRIASIRSIWKSRINSNLTHWRSMNLSGEWVIALLWMKWSQALWLLLIPSIVTRELSVLLSRMIFALPRN
jgi:iron complex outermembrane receptor protein